MELVGRYYKIMLGEIHRTKVLSLYEVTLLFGDSDWIIYVVFLHTL